MPECFSAVRSSDLNVDQTTCSNVESSSDSFRNSGSVLEQIVYS